MEGQRDIDPKDLDAKKEILESIQIENDIVIKECMEWEWRILHSTALAYLKPKKATTDYHMPMLPYPLLK